MEILKLVLKMLPVAVLIAIITISTSFAQTGSLSGQITDANTGEPLGGATVMIENTSRGTTSDFLNGEFSLRRIPVGEQTIIFRYMGYVSQTFSVTIEEGVTSELNVELTADVVGGEDIVVSAQALGQAQAIQRQLNASSIINAISEAKIRELADANAAESVGRLPGISVIRDAGEGSRIAIRGLAPQYNAITVDGVRMTGTDAETRAVDLNMISQEMLSGIEVYKSNRPDMDADAIGGTVNFSLATVPEGSRYRASLKGGYNNHVQEAGNFGASFSGSDRYLDNKIGVFLALDFERNDRSSDVSTGDFQVLRDARDDEEFAPLALTNGWLVDREEVRDRLGGTLNLDFTVPNGKITVSNFLNRLNRDEVRLFRGLNVEEFRQDWRLHDREIQVDVMSNRLRGIHSIYDERIEVDWRATRSVSHRSHPFDHRLRFEENGAFDDTIIDESLGIPGILPSAKNRFNATNWHRSEISGNDVKEREFTGELDITIPFQTDGLLSGEFKIGGKHVNKDRNRESDFSELIWFDGEELTFIMDSLQTMGFFGEDGYRRTSTGTISMINFLDPDYSNDDFLNGQYSGMNPWPIGLRGDLLRTIANNFEDVHIPRAAAVFNNNGATERITAAYIMTELDIGSRLMILPGIRYEYTDSEYRAKFGTITDPRNEIQDVTINDTTGVRTFGDFYPMIQGRYNVTDWFDIRAAYTQSTSRPSFNQLVPRVGTNSNARTVSRGHPNLKPLKSTNYDLFLTFNSNKIGLFTLGGFYKSIDNLVYDRQIVTLDPVSIGLPPTTNFYSVTEPANNEEETIVRGFEIEWQSNLLFMPAPFNGMVINANLSRIWSETQFPLSELRRGPDGLVRVDSSRTARMPFQPDLIANVAVGYEYKGFSSRASVNFQGETLTFVGSRRETDRFSEDFISWDLSIRQKINNIFSVYANFYNITNEPETAKQFTGQFITDEEYFNWTAEVGLRLDFR